MLSNLVRNGAWFLRFAFDKDVYEVACRRYFSFAPSEQAKLVAHAASTDPSSSQPALDHRWVAKGLMEAAQILHGKRHYRAVQQIETAFDGQKMHDRGVIEGVKSGVIHMPIRIHVVPAQLQCMKVFKIFTTLIIEG